MSECIPSENPLLFSTSQRWLGLFIFLFGVTVIVTSIGWWMTRSNHPLLAKRNFGLMVVSAFGIFLELITSGLTNFIGRDKFPCDLTLWATMLFLPLAAGPVAARMVLTTYRIRFGKLILEDIDEESEDFDPELYETGSLAANARAFFRSLFSCKCESMHDVNEMHEHLMDVSQRRLMSRRFSYALSPQGGIAVSSNSLATGGSGGNGRPRRASRTRAIFFGKSSAYGVVVQVFVTVVSIFIGIALSVSSDTNFGFQGCTGCEVDGRGFAAFLVTGILVFLIVAPTTVILWRVNDPNGIVRELRIIAFFGFILLLAAVLSVIDPKNLRADGEFDWFYLFSLSCLGIHFTQCIYPIMLTYRENRIRRQGHKDSTTLSMILEHPSAKRVFQTYLAQEWSSENGVFLDAVTRFRARHPATSTRDIVARIVDIYATFIKDGSMLEVNVPSSIKRDLQNKIVPLQTMLETNSSQLDTMHKPDIGIFDAAYDEVYELIENDSFPRFQLSHLYEQAKTALSRKTAP